MNLEWIKETGKYVVIILGLIVGLTSVFVVAGFDAGSAAAVVTKYVFIVFGVYAGYKYYRKD